MTKTTKIIIAVVVGILILGVGYGLATFTTDTKTTQTQTVETSQTETPTVEDTTEGITESAVDGYTMIEGVPGKNNTGDHNLELMVQAGIKALDFTPDFWYIDYFDGGGYAISITYTDQGHECNIIHQIDYDYNVVAQSTAIDGVIQSVEAL